MPTIRAKRNLQQEGEADPLDAINQFIQRTQKGLVNANDSALSAGIVLLPPNMVTIPKAFATSTSDAANTDDGSIASSSTDAASANQPPQTPYSQVHTQPEATNTNVLPAQPTIPSGPSGNYPHTSPKRAEDTNGSSEISSENAPGYPYDPLPEINESENTAAPSP